MANFAGHFLGGLITAILLSWYAWSSQTIQNLAVLGALMGATIFGSLFPDLDTKSIIQLWLYRVIVLGLIVLYVHKITTLLLVVPVALMIPMVVRHRGMFHQVWFLLLSALAIGTLLYRYTTFSYDSSVLIASSFLIGTCMHLILDFGCTTTVQKIIRLQ